MCLEDIRLGRETQSGFTTLVLDGNDQPLLPQSPSRISLLLNPPSAGVAFYHTGSTIVADQGIRLAAGDGPLRLDIQRDGDLVRRAWRVRGESADTITDTRVRDESTSAANAAVLATIAGVAGEQIVIDSILASYSAAVAGFTLELDDGATIVWRQVVFNNYDATFPGGLAMPVGNDANLTLAAGGAGVVGRVFLSGFRRATVTAFGDVTVYETHLHKE